MARARGAAAVSAGDEAIEAAVVDRAPPPLDRGPTLLPAVEGRDGSDGATLCAAKGEIPASPPLGTPYAAASSIRPGRCDGAGSVRDSGTPAGAPPTGEGG